MMLIKFISRRVIGVGGLMNPINIDTPSYRSIMSGIHDALRLLSQVPTSIQLYMISQLLKTHAIEAWLNLSFRRSLIFINC